MIASYLTLSSIAGGSVLLGSAIGLRGVVPVTSITVATVALWALS